MIKNLAGAILVMMSVQIVAQSTDSSPYSSLGIGNVVPNKTVEEMSMGGVGTAKSTFQLGFSNPANYSALFLTTYTLAAENRAYWFEDVNGKDNSSNAYLSYVGMGIPLGDKGGFAFGLQLNSTVGYEIIDSTLDEDDEIISLARYEGVGGTNRVFLGFGYEVVPGLSLGIEGKYVFGKSENILTEQLRDVQLATRHLSTADLSGYGVKLGLNYEKEYESGLAINIGTAIELEDEVNSNANDYLFSLEILSIVPRDTILAVESKGVYKTPLKTNLGVSIGKRTKWGVSVDYSFRDAIEMEGHFLTRYPKLQHEKASTIALGGYFIPKYNSISSYWDRVAYRGGLRFEQTGLMVNTDLDNPQFTSIDNFGISFGMGLPVGRGYSKLDASFEYGKRGTIDNGLTKENYFNFRIGIALSDKWFKKREIN